MTGVSGTLAPLAATKPSFFFFAACAAGLLWWRRRHLEPPLLIGLVIVIVGLVVYGSGVIDPPDLEKTLEDLGETLGQWTYLLVGVLAFLETGAFVGLLAPGETAIMVGGLVAGQGRIELITLIAIVWTAAVAGDVTSFFIGRRLGRGFLVKHGPRFQITEARLLQVEAFFERHGGKAILIGRFVGIIRAIAPFLAGSSGMSFRRFFPYDVIGAGIWGTTFCLLGYIFWRSFGQLVDVAKQGAFALGTIITVVVASVIAYRWLKVEENRDRLRAWLYTQEEKRVLRPFVRLARRVWHRVRGPLRFAWDRLTPGGLWLEMTTLFAIAAVGAFALIGGLINLRNSEFAAGDLRGLDAVDDLRRGWLDDVARTVTDLGALPVAGGVLLLVALVLLVRRPRLDGVVLLAGMGLTMLVVNIVQDEKARPRPLGGLVDSDGFSYPSEHAAYAFAWVAVAVAVSRALPGFFSRAILVSVAIVIASAVTLSRVYLRVNYLTDVLAGAGAAALCFAIVAMTGLVVSFLRDNGRRSPTPQPPAADPTP
jgi:membrane protein DedA with SNARE-associated domain